MVSNSGSLEARYQIGDRVKVSGRVESMLWEYTKYFTPGVIDTLPSEKNIFPSGLAARKNGIYRILFTTEYKHAIDAIYLGKSHRYIGQVHPAFTRQWDNEFEPGYMDIERRITVHMVMYTDKSKYMYRVPVAVLDEQIAYE